MPRRKPVEFKIPDGKTKPLPQGLHRIPPQNQTQALIMASDEKRERCSYVLAQYAHTLQMKKVRSNEELINRGFDYFKFCADRKLVPTVEGLASFCGINIRTLLAWQKKELHGFNDGEMETSEIVDQLKGILDAVDGDLALSGEISAIAWIFRRKVLNRWIEAQKIEIETTGGEEKPPLSAEEIARRLPDPDTDYSLELEELNT